ncbi:MAG TPA: sigma-70 family RNA polymerase sigma factor [Lysobacter sp.]|nr:sigma-70 family RNA polymerase sigma factor [Lysobacter sp.]
MDQPATDPQLERTLLTRARLGNRQAFEELYARHAPAVHALAFRLTGDRATAEDIAQDTFLRMLKFLGGLRSDQPLRPWLKRVAANAAIDHLRRNRRLQLADMEAEWPDPSASTETGAEIHGLLRRLPPPVRTVVWLHLMEGWSHRELADRFGRSESWSKSLLSRALRTLQSETEPATPP